MSATNFNGATAVLVHAAFADASSWSKIIVPLQQKGMEVVAVQIPLTSLSDDVAVVRRTLKRLRELIVLVDIRMLARSFPSLAAVTRT